MQKSGQRQFWIEYEDGDGEYLWPRELELLLINPTDTATNVNHNASSTVPAATSVESSELYFQYLQLSFNILPKSLNVSLFSPQLSCNGCFGCGPAQINEIIKFLCSAYV